MATDKSRLSDEIQAGLKTEEMSRRRFLGTTAVVGLSGAGLASGLASCGKQESGTNRLERGHVILLTGAKTDARRR